ncbi:hypothetical protein MNBD_GAMMA04-824, partial [hydrothermal vent metagenome]
MQSLLKRGLTLFLGGGGLKLRQLAPTKFV